MRSEGGKLARRFSIGWCVGNLGLSPVSGLAKVLPVFRSYSVFYLLIQDSFLIVGGVELRVCRVICGMFPLVVK